MLSDIISPSSISLSNIRGMTVSIYGDSTPSGSAAGVATVLDDVILPSNAFAANGDFMEFEYAGAFFGDADTQVDLLLGSEVVFPSGVMDPAAEYWVLKGKMIRWSASAQITTARLITNTLKVVNVSSNSLTFGDPMHLKLRGVGTSAHAVDLWVATRQFYFQNR